MTPLLQVNALRKTFGELTAVDGCSFSVEPGTVTALIGPNGSGKTTVFNLITGYLPADSGTVEFAGRDITRRSPGKLYRDGLTRTFQQARVFPQLTVRENLVAARGYSWRQLFQRAINTSDNEASDTLIDEFNLRTVADHRAAELSWGQRKLLEFAAVLMSDPKLVLLDEPTAGVNPILIETMESHIRERNRRGVTFLIVEHDMTFVMRSCNPVIVLDAGAVIARGEPADVQTDPAVLDAYLGA